MIEGVESDNISRIGNIAGIDDHASSFIISRGTFHAFPWPGVNGSFKEAAILDGVEIGSAFQAHTYHTMVQVAGVHAVIRGIVQIDTGGIIALSVVANLQAQKGDITLATGNAEGFRGHGNRIRVCRCAFRWEEYIQVGAISEKSARHIKCVGHKVGEGLAAIKMEAIVVRQIQFCGIGCAVNMTGCIIQGPNGVERSVPTIKDGAFAGSIANEDGVVSIPGAGENNAFIISAFMQ